MRPVATLDRPFSPYALWTIEGMGKEPAPVSSTKIAASPARWPAPSPKRERGRALAGGRRSGLLAFAGPSRLVGLDGLLALWVRARRALSAQLSEQVRPSVPFDQLVCGLLHVPLDLVGRLLQVFPPGEVLLEHPVKLVSVLHRQAPVKGLDAEDP